MTTPDDFQFDVFLSHSAKDKAVEPRLAGRLQVGVRQPRKVWLDERAHAKEEAAKWTSASELQPLAFTLCSVPR